MTKAGMGMVVMGFALLGGCATGVAERRGSMVMQPDSVRAFAEGPAVVHAFSMDGGGRIFVAPATTGTDADCASASAASKTEVVVDRRNTVTVAPGQVACVVASARHNYELLWHARPIETPSQTLLIAQARR
jgi:hypothetical protein